ncbi:gluconokinase [Microbacterium phyllosphaerae]|uniref:gluconokinase n=1 Tax=Microbacterium phyllosphaerae TaxID=124798 RepID=UPI0021676529|nr:gluconokinase [Microbacterium phyllosphaerae]MCS3442460.1 carbohydrate kinase (thermoresistant glucokinase family) [Microbacterium phyllosphaerae]
MSAHASPQIVVMGVSAAGKSTVGRLLATDLGLAFLDADDLHPASNRAKMSAGTPLTDDDRMPWLDRVSDELATRSASGAVIACSALRRVYRDRIRERVPGVVFVHLHGDDALLAERATGRTDHFMPPSLLRSQLDTLEMLDADETGVVVDVSRPPAELARTAVEWLESRRT